MAILLDAEIQHSFWPSLDIARKRALSETANTGGIILSICSIEVQPRSLVFIGDFPVIAFELTSARTGGRPKINSRAMRTLHTTWGALMCPQDTIGYFVMQQPVTMIAGRVPDEKETLHVAMEVTRRFTSVPTLFIGPVCCVGCNEPIPAPRLKTIPGVRTCTNCQQLKEGKRK